MTGNITTIRFLNKNMALSTTETGHLVLPLAIGRRDCMERFK